MLLSTTVIPVGITFAQGVNDFEIISFGAVYKLTNQDPQGTLEVTETIQVDFQGQNRGILRAIPASYQGNSLQLEILDVQRDSSPEPYITYEENDNIVIRIGDADDYVTGKHTYHLSYKVENVITFYDDHDELYWDVNGDEWLQPFESVTAVLLHETTSNKELPARCFTGLLGTTGAECVIVEDVNRLDIATTSELRPGETLTFVQSFEKGYFTPQGWLEKHWRLLILAPVVLLQLAFVRSAFNKWKQHGKDRSLRPIAPFYGRPRNVSVMLASYVRDNRLDQKAVSASIIDLSVRGYIRIVERKVGRNTKHDLILKNPDYSKLSKEEQLLLNGLFTSKEVDSTVELESKKAKLNGTMQSITKQLDKASTKSGYYDISPKNPGRYLGKEITSILVLLVISVLLSKITEGISIATGFVGFFLVAVFALLMTRRSQKGAELKEHMEGLKLYLDMAEKDRIKQQDAVEAPLSPHSGQPERTVKFFEKMLPFAVAMGVEKSWSKAFADIYTQAPEWYQGTWKNGFSTGALANSLNATTGVVSQSFSAPSSSSGSGFSGGGFAGGGGGGGGGGGW